jgi:signal transduction histidine kinase
MVNSLLDVGRMEAGQMPLRLVGVDLRHLAEQAAEAMQLLAGAKNIRLVVQGPEVPLHADRDLIRRVFINLIGNAVKFAPQGGQVTISVSASDGRTRAEVHDDGCGIPEQYHQRIFEKFIQVDTCRPEHKHSTGLGLAFCRLAVVAHGGNVGVQSRPGEGSTFWFSLPVSHAADPSSELGKCPLQECSA